LSGNKGGGRADIAKSVIYWRLTQITAVCSHFLYRAYPVVSSPAVYVTYLWGGITHLFGRSQWVLVCCRLITMKIAKGKVSLVSIMSFLPGCSWGSVHCWSVHLRLWAVVYYRACISAMGSSQHGARTN